MATTTTTQARSAYRRLLRELPSRSPSLLANPSFVQREIRADFSTPLSSSSSTINNNSSKSDSLRLVLQKLQEVEQYIHYLRAQRTYTALLERYNPGMNMGDEERIRLTARRVGMEMPAEMGSDGGSGGRKRD